MIRFISLTTAVYIAMVMTGFAQGDGKGDDPMVKEFEKFLKTKGGQSQLQNDPEYRNSVNRRDSQLKVINEAIEQQDAAVAGTRDDIDKVITLYASRAQTRGTAVDHYLYGRILGQTGELDDAYREFMKALELDRYLAWAWDGLGVYHSNKENWSEAIEKFQRVLQLWPGHVKATFGLAQCYFRQQRFGEGVTRLQEILARKEVREDQGVVRQTRLLIAEALRSQRKWDEAIDVLSEVLEAHPNDDRVLSMRAWCARRLERFTDAARDYRQIIENRPQERRFYEQLADCLVAQGLNHDAKKVLEDLLIKAGANMTPEQTTRTQETIDFLARKPVREDPRKRAPTFDDFINRLANSPHVDKRREAIIILAKAPSLPRKDPRAEILYKAFIGALRDSDHVVRCKALEQVNNRYPSERVMNVTKLFGSPSHEKDSRVRGMANHLLSDYPAKYVTAALVQAAGQETDLYAFRRIHESLNASTLAWIERVLPNDLEVEDMVRIRKKWMAWYKRNRDLYRRWEPKDFDLR